MLLAAALTHRPARAAPEAEPVAVIMAVGDVTLGGHFEPWIDGLYARGAVDDHGRIRYGMDRVRDLLTPADVTLANLEGTFAQQSPRGPGKFVFKARPELAAVLLDGGVDVVSLGNNHIMDYGPGGVVETLGVLDAAGIGWSGAGRDTAEARRPWRTEVRGLTLGFLSYKVTGLHNVRQPDKGVVFTATGPTVAWCHFDWVCIRDMVTEDVTRLAGEVDVVVVSFHWGQERKYDTDTYQVVLGRLAIDSGAKVVVGHHPHVVQGVELHGDGVIFYSLGNFLFGGNAEPFDPIGAVAEIHVGRRGVVSATLHPVRTTSASAPFQPTPLVDPERESVLRQIALRSRGFPRPIAQLGGL
ncbi:MAG: CapA family protein [Deltaproteobacteria bacterium]|nr:CapA family protein [Deltaproteobacteria bacterium]